MPESTEAIQMYKPMTADAMNEVAQAGALEVKEFWPAPVGNSFIRGLPLPGDFKQKSVIVIMHIHTFTYSFPDKNAQGGFKKVLYQFACPKLNPGADGRRGKFCRGCDFVLRTKATNWQLANERSARAYYYMNIVHRGFEELGPQTFRFSDTVFQAMKTATDMYGDFSNPTDEGYDFCLTRVGTGIQTEWSLAAYMNPKDPRNLGMKGFEKLAFEWIRTQRDLSVYQAVPDDATIYAGLKEASTNTRGENKQESQGGRQQQAPAPSGFDGPPPMGDSAPQDVPYESIGAEATQQNRSQSDRNAGGNDNF